MLELIDDEEQVNIFFFLLFHVNIGPVGLQKFSKTLSSNSLQSDLFVAPIFNDADFLLLMLQLVVMSLIS